MTLEEVANAFRRRGVEVVRQGHSLRCPCPAHQGKDANLELTDREGGGVKVRCWSHDCSIKEIAAAVGLEVTDFIPPAVTNGSHGKADLGTVVERYRYDDERGNLLFEVWRYEPKNFRPHHIGPDGQWRMGLPTGCRMPLYRLQELQAADPKEPVFICAGEKDVENVRRLGLIATTNQGGEERKWARYPEWVETLKGRYCVVLEDHDKPDTKRRVRPGEEHAKEVFAALTEAEIKAKRLLLPGLAEGEDVTDWIIRGGTAEALRELARPELRFRLVTLEEMLALPLPTWQIDGLWEQGGVVMVYGEGSSGKTFLVVDLSMHLVRHMDWHGRNVEGGAVIYVNADGGIRFRLRPQAWEFEFPDVPKLFPFLIYNDRIDMREKGTFQAFVDDVQQQTQAPAIVVLDTFHRMMPGADENAGEDTSRFFDALQAVRRDLGSTALFVHHSNRADTGHRGHSSLRDDSDTVIEVRREESGLRRVRCDKQRNGAEFPEFWFDLRPTLEGESCVIEMADAPAAEEQTESKRRGVRPGEEDKIQATLRAIVAAGEIAQGDLVLSTGFSQPRVSYYCRVLRQRGLIDSREGMAESGRRPTLYSPRLSR